jgi:hypothetical protein
LEKNNSLNKEEHEYKAIGVEAHDEANGQLITIKARKEIILSAGYVKIILFFISLCRKKSRSFRMQTLISRLFIEKSLLFSAYKSPVILMHSGIGWEKHLTEMNIDCKVNLHGVGENLLDHVVVRIFILASF